jgi:integrase
MRNEPVRVAENLYRDPSSGVYWGRKKVNGKRKWECLAVDNRALANAKLKTWLRELEARDASKENFKLGALADLYEVSKRGLKESTGDFYRVLVGTFRKTFPTGMNFNVDQVRHSHLLTWLTQLEQERDWAHRTFNAHRAMLRDMFALAEADRIVTTESNPFKAHLLKPRRKTKVVREFPSTAEFYNVIRNVREQESRHAEASADFLQFLGELGVGQAEAQDLTWKNVGEEFITFTRRKTGVTFTVPIYVWARPLIAKLQAASRPDYRLAPNSPVFSIENPKRALENACKRLKLRHYSPRNLRQQLIMRLAQAGIDARQIAKWQAHNDGGVLIQKVYCNGVSSDEKDIERQNIEKLQRAA